MHDNGIYEDKEKQVRKENVGYTEVRIKRKRRRSRRSKPDLLPNKPLHKRYSFKNEIISYKANLLYK
jgi:hypothetical protein